MKGSTEQGRAADLSTVKNGVGFVGVILLSPVSDPDPAIVEFVKAFARANVARDRARLRLARGAE